MVVSKRHFIEGVTTRSRVTAEMMGACVETSDGYNPETDDLVAEFGLTNAISFPSTVNAPPAYCDGYLVATCADGKIYAHKSSVNAGRTCPTPVGSIVNMGSRCVVPTESAMFAYEPRYNAIRPLSVKAPYDYSSTEKPNVTWGDTTAAKLWEWDDASDWDSTLTIDVVDTRASITLSSSVSADSVIASIDADVDPTNKSWIMVDVMQDNDTQLYSASGLFINDAALYPSGYCIELLDAADGSLGVFRIPKMDAAGRAYRFAINIGEITSVIKKVNIRVDSFWVYSAGAILTVWCGEYNQQWSACGGWLLPAPVWDGSPMYETLTATATNAVVAGTSNMISDSSFTTNPFTNPSSGWVAGSYVSWDQNIGRSAGGAVRLHSYEDGSLTAGISTKAPIDVIAGQWCTLTFWASQLFHRNIITLGYKPVDIVVEVSATNGTDTRYWYIDGEWREEVAASLPCLWHTDTIGKWTEYRLSFKVPVMAGSVTLGIKFKRRNYSIDRSIAIDDVVLTRSNLRQQGTTVLLQTMADGGDDRFPAPQMIEYAYGHVMRDTLASKFEYEYSNLSNFTAPVVADPWSKPTVSITPPNGAGGIATAVVDPDGGGAGYNLNDIIVPPIGTGGALTVTGVSGGAVTALSVTAAGSGYNSSTFTDTGGAVITITSNGNTVKDDYATYTVSGESTPYLIGYLVYARVTDGMGVTAMPYLERFIKENGEEGSLNDLFPTMPYIYNDYASPARHLMVADGRLYAACLDYSDATWLRPSYIQVSAFRRPYAFATTNGVDALPTDGTELGDFAVTGMEIRALAMRNATKLVFMDNEYFEMEGDNLAQGWRFGRRGSIGCKQYTPADCNSTLVWCDGRNFWALTLDGAASVSRERIDPSLISWNKQYNAIAFGDRYIMCCEYKGTRGLLVLDTTKMAWRFFTGIPTASTYICSDGETVRIAAGSNVWSLVNTPSTMVRTIKTSPLVVAPDGYDTHVNRVSIDVDVDPSSSASVAMTVAVTAYGLKNTTTSTNTLTFTRNECRRWIGLDVNAHSVSVTITTNTNINHRVVGIALEASDVPNNR